ncbi:MAG: flagellar basal-body rod protein FlgG [Thermoleophilaceae bacterium]|jgi:flagellar basal-body rod protein FlgG|nr:flagellar basal-body rod protein FlgG [Thermoleophilaceae bacterium]
MLEGLYTAAAGMAAQQQRMDALSNDVANVNTSGYKRVRIGFRDLVYQATGGSGVMTGAGSAAVQLGRGQDQGALLQTDQPFDLAIEGDGYFQVRQSNTGQIALTRNGQLQVNANGQLVTAEGDQLVPPITLPRGIDPNRVAIGPDGTLSTGTRRLGQIQLVTVPAPTGLAAAGNGYYTVTAASGGVRRATTATLQQGMLEASNVNLADAMVDMMDAQRSFSMASKAIHMQDQMMEIANGVKQ